jgi:hypothetical protein
MYLFETTCQIQLAAQSGGAELLRVDQGIVDGAMDSVKAQAVDGSFVWPALLRKLDRIDASYRQ